MLMIPLFFFVPIELDLERRGFAHDDGGGGFRMAVGRRERAPLAASLAFHRRLGKGFEVFFSFPGLVVLDVPHAIPGQCIDLLASTAKFLSCAALSCAALSLLCCLLVLFSPCSQVLAVFSPSLGPFGNPGWNHIVTPSRIPPLSRRTRALEAFLESFSDAEKRPLTTAARCLCACGFEDALHAVSRGVNCDVRGAWSRVGFWRILWG